MADSVVVEQMQMPHATAPAPDGEAQQPASGALEEPVSPPTALPSAGPYEEHIKKLLTKRQYILNELIDTEKEYVRDLGLVVNGYIPMFKEMTLPEDFVGKDKIVWGNIQGIYEFHKDTFAPELDKAFNSATPTDIGMVFSRFRGRLCTLYVKFCENKPKADYIVGEYFETVFAEAHARVTEKLELNEQQRKLKMNDLIIKPVQRIMKYQLLLKDILKQTERANQDTKQLKLALNVMTEVPKEADDMMQFGRLQGFEGSVVQQGKVLVQDKVQLSENVSAPRFRERRLFLFERILIVAEEIAPRNKSVVPVSTYIFKRSIGVMTLFHEDRVPPAAVSSSLPDGVLPRLFIVGDRSRLDVRFLVDPLSDDSKATWLEKLRGLHQSQNDFLNALLDPQGLGGGKGEIPDEAAIVTNDRGGASEATLRHSASAVEAKAFGDKSANKDAKGGASTAAKKSTANKPRHVTTPLTPNTINTISKASGFALAPGTPEPQNEKHALLKKSLSSANVCGVDLSKPSQSAKLSSGFLSNLLGRSRNTHSTVLPESQSPLVPPQDSPSCGGGTNANIHRAELEHAEHLGAAI